jgi:S-DNA-T family DNA segregation ATPase FtsK/SpoIIIE
MKSWKQPPREGASWCGDMLHQPHLLIAGSTGSGKSVLINTLIYTALEDTPTQTQLILIDPKRVELIDYKPIPHVLEYASEPDEIQNTLQCAVALMEYRYKHMQKHHQKQSDRAHVHIIIDEFADLMTTQKKQTLPHLIRIAQLGRAANIHLIIATQRPTKDIINGQIKVNIDNRIALRCPTAQDSRNIINVKGAETLPKYGYGYYLTSNGCDLITIPMTAQEAIQQRVEWWTKQTRFSWFRR